MSRLRDTDDDGRADEVTEFIPSIDSPRGLLWDEDRLYVLHPPHLSVYYDRDGDGVSEENRRLVDNIAFDFKERPADHTTNGLDLGVDGWIYVSTGDFGFMEATGSDGRKLQVRGGGVVRVRPDGSGIELFLTAPEIFSPCPPVPCSICSARTIPTMVAAGMYAFITSAAWTTMATPPLLKLSREIIAPFADYGGGSGCGGMYLHEPGFPDEWNRAPMTCDWGTAGLWHHSVERKCGI